MQSCDSHGPIKNNITIQKTPRDISLVKKKKNTFHCAVHGIQVMHSLLLCLENVSASLEPRNCRQHFALSGLFCNSFIALAVALLERRCVVSALRPAAAIASEIPPGRALQHSPCILLICGASVVFWWSFFFFNVLVLQMPTGKKKCIPHWARKKHLWLGACASLAICARSR
jgi:hypothetical protein